MISQLVLAFLGSIRWRIVVLKDEHGVLLLEDGFFRLFEVLVKDSNVHMAVYFVLNLHKMSKGFTTNIDSQRESCSNLTSRRFKTCRRKNV